MYLLLNGVILVLIVFVSTVYAVSGPVPEAFTINYNSLLNTVLLGVVGWLIRSAAMQASKRDEATNKRLDELYKAHNESCMRLAVIEGRQEIVVKTILKEDATDVLKALKTGLEVDRDKDEVKGESVTTNRRRKQKAG
jgi:hypothetical protein